MDWPLFIKFCSYFCTAKFPPQRPRNYVKRQLAKEEIAFEALDNGIRSRADPKRLQETCNGLTPAKIQAFWQSGPDACRIPFLPRRAVGFQVSTVHPAGRICPYASIRIARCRAGYLEQYCATTSTLGRPDRMQLILIAASRTTPRPASAPGWSRHR